MKKISPQKHGGSYSFSCDTDKPAYITQHRVEPAQGRMANFAKVAKLVHARKIDPDGDRKDAVYWVDKQELPVFLLVVDLVGKVAYWLFIQKYLTHDLKGQTSPANWILATSHWRGGDKRRMRVNRGFPPARAGFVRATGG